MLRWLLAPGAGIEPATNGLTVHCSAAELPRNLVRREEYSKAGGVAQGLWKTLIVEANRLRIGCS